MVQEKARLDEELRREVAVVVEQERKEAERQKPAELPMDLTTAQIGQLYLQAIETYGNLRTRSDEPGRDQNAMDQALAAIRVCGKALVRCGYPEALDNALYFVPGNILVRLMSIKYDRAVGYKLKTAWQVINAIFQENPPHTQWQTLPLIAIKVYSPTLDDKQRSIIKAQRDRVIDSLRAGGGDYRRPRKYDKLLSLLFPEMAVDLAKPLPGIISAELSNQVPVSPKISLPPPSKTPIELASCTAEPKRSFGFERCSWENGPVIIQNVCAADEELITLGHRMRDQGLTTDEALKECCSQFPHELHTSIIFAWIDAGLVKQNLFATEREYKNWRNRYAIR